MLCGVYCVWIAAAGVVGGCAVRAPSVACLSRVRGYACVCVPRAGCVTAGIWGRILVQFANSQLLTQLCVANFRVANFTFANIRKSVFSNNL